MQFGQMRRAKQITLWGMALALFASPVLANPTLVIDANSGQVLIESQPTANWYPASVTKLMTVYVALQAVRAGRMTMDTPFVVSQRAANMPASKMGFRPGTQVTLDNALKMLMVKSPNDIAVTVAEGVSGSVEAFADEMNAAAAHLGLKESHFVNPNGLPDARQVSSARDMAMIARALLKEFPEENDIFGIGALQLGNQIITTHNGLIGHYPGADGMKTGFTCAAGFNVVASATHGGRRLIAVVLGSSSARERTAQAAALFDRAFAQWSGGLGAVESLPSPGVNSAPDMHQEICSRRGRAAILAGEEEEFAAPVAAASVRGGAGGASMYAAAVTGASALTGAPAAVTRSLVVTEPVHFAPVPVFVGPKPGWTGPVLAARTPDAVASKASPTATDKATPAEASAYVATDKAQALDKDETPALEAPTAPMALQGALKPATAKSLNGPAGKRPPTKLAQQNKLKPPAAAHSAAVKPAPKTTSDPSPNPVVAPAH
jgi:D-alanyl-D-alanine carboxypeptidase